MASVRLLATPFSTAAFKALSYSSAVPLATALLSTYAVTLPSRRRAYFFETNCQILPATWSSPLDFVVSYEPNSLKYNSRKLLSSSRISRVTSPFFFAFIISAILLLLFFQKTPLFGGGGSSSNRCISVYQRASTCS